MHRRSSGRSWTATAGLLLAFSLLAAACGGDDDSGEDTAAPTETEAPAETEASTETEAPAEIEASTETEAPAETEASAETDAPEPEVQAVYGGKIVVAGESEVANPWTPAAMNCDSYCHLRVRAFYDPLMAWTDDAELAGHLAESVEPNDDDTVFTVKLREGISFHDGTPLDADAVMENLDRSFSSLLIAAAVKDVARNDDGSVLMEKVDDFTFTIATGKDGNPDEPLPWPTFPSYLAGQGGYIASPTWLAAVDAGEASPSEPVGTGPFGYDDYAPGDKLVVKRNPDYWMSDAEGNQLPYLDEVEYRVIPDSQVRRQALESGDLDLMATSDTQVVNELADDDSLESTIQDQFGSTNYILLHVTLPHLADKSVRCALWQGLDIPALLEVTTAGYGVQANGLFSMGQEGFLDDNGAPAHDPEAAKAAIEAYEADNGPISFNYSTTPTATNLTSAQFIQQAWGAIGVDVNIDQIEQSKLINNALFGDPAFEGFGWRNHSGVYVDSQYFWWHGSAAQPDGELALNFGRVDDAEINALLESARSEADPDARRSFAEDINRRFASECYVIPTSWTQWGIHSGPTVQNLGGSPTADGTAVLGDGIGSGGTVWLTGVFVGE